ncbi:MAG: trypsin-like peptidase domain-containing protein, partial [Pseudomonadota bacterium]
MTDETSSDTPSTGGGPDANAPRSTGEGGDTQASRDYVPAWWRPTWWTLSALAFIASTGVVAYLMLREPDTEYVDGPPGPRDPESVQELADLDDRTDGLKDRVARLRRDVIEDQCPPGLLKGPEYAAIDPSRIPPELDDDGKPIEPMQSARRSTEDPPQSTRSNRGSPTPLTDTPRGNSETGRGNAEEGPELDSDIPLGPPPARPAPVSRPTEPEIDRDVDQVDPLTTRLLVKRLEEASALIVAVPTDGKRPSIGSGFFIAPEILVTNRHVVERADPRGVIVTSQSIGKSLVGKVLSMSPPGPVDFAVVRVPGAPRTAVLPVTLNYEKLMGVVTAGYPGLTIGSDKGFQDLLRGDFTSAPALVLNEGAIQAIQKQYNNNEIIVHSTDVLQGNSGGPLVDRCGRVVG